LLAIVLLQENADAFQLSSDVEECLKDQRDIFVGDHPARVAEVRDGRKLALSG